MNYVAYLILRRLRAPLITLIVIYSISVLGYVLIPGMDSAGNAYRMSFFEAFYFVSFILMSTSYETLTIHLFVIRFNT